MRKPLIFIIIFIVAAATLMARGGRIAAGGTDRDSLIIGNPSFPVSLDPVLANDIHSARVHSQIFDTLVAFDYDMSIIPSLAERWSFDDPARLRLFLGRNIRFHSGEELTARDVQWSLERAAASPHIGHITGMIQAVEVINDHELIITLTHPFVPILSHLAHTATSILSERAVTRLGVEAHALAPVGTGAYRISGIVNGDRIDFTRWDQYHGRPARIRDITLLTIGDPAARLTELDAGRIDIMLDLYTIPHDISRVNANANLRVLRGDTLQTNFVYFNTQVLPFNDARIRQAIAYAIDWDTVNRTVYEGIGSTATGTIAPAVWGSIAGRLPQRAFNPARARQLLAEAGHPIGFDTRIYVADFHHHIETATVMQGMLYQVGVRAAIVPLDWGPYLGVIGAGEHTIALLGWSAITGDPDYGLHPVFHSSNQGMAGNFSFFRNAEVDRLLDEGRREQNPQRRLDIYRQVQEILYKELPVIPKWVAEVVHAARADLRGWRLHPAQFDKWQNIYFEY